MGCDVGIWFRFAIAALATWRLAFLLAREPGPWGVFTRFRSAVGAGLLAELLTCVKCMGVWVAIPFALFVRGSMAELLVIWLALAAVTALIDEWTRQPFEWHESKEDEPLQTDAKGHCSRDT
jgi:hypothetical protein